MTNRSYLETAYKLKQNPFANLVDPNVEMAGRLKEKQQWTEIVETRKDTNANTMCFILGDYGFGKTLTLNKIVEQYKDDPDVLPIFMKMLPEDKVTKFGVDFIQRIFRQVPQSTFESFSLNDLVALEKTYPEPAKVFRWIALKDSRGIIDFIYGQRSFSASEMSKLGIKRKIDRTDIAKEYLLSFLYLLKGIKKKTLLIGVDETEYVFSQMGSGASIAMVFNTLRDLYDLTTSPTMPKVPGPTANMIFFFAISSGGFLQFQDLGKREAAKPGPVQPLLRRILDEQIELSPLSLDETKELIEKRLRENRSGKVEDKPLIPYDDSFVKYVHELSGGNPSRVVRFCDAALEEGLREQIKILNEDFAKKAFIAHGLLVE
jgi:type II secretory pathway predicted ATPase ExeA